MLQKSRPDYAEYVEQLGLDLTTAEPATLMARSWGRRMTDQIEVFAPPDVNSAGELEVYFLVRGVRHVAGAAAAISTLSVGDQLKPEAEPDNAYNKDAVRLVTPNGQKVGFLPDFFIGELDPQSPAFHVEVARLNPHPAPIHHRILCKLTTQQPHVPFSGPEYEPLSADAKPQQAAE